MVYSVRKRCGRQLAKEHPVDVDIVSTVPESATPAAIAYAQEVSTKKDFPSLCILKWVGGF